MVRLIVIIVALLLVIAGGAGGLIRFGIVPDFTGMLGGPQATEDAQAEPVAERHPPVFVDVQPLTIAVIVDGRLKKNVYVSFRLQVDPAYRDEILLSLEQMRNIYITTLHKELGEQYKTRDLVDVTTLKAQLLAVSQRSLGRDRVKAVVIEALFNR